MYDTSEKYTFFQTRKLFSKLTWSSWNLLILKMHPSHPLSCYYVVTYTSIHVSNILPLTCHDWPQGPTSFRALDLQEAFISSLNESLLKIQMKFSYSTFYNLFKNQLSVVIIIPKNENSIVWIQYTVTCMYEEIGK